MHTLLYPSPMGPVCKSKPGLHSFGKPIKTRTEYKIHLRTN